MENHDQLKRTYNTAVRKAFNLFKEKDIRYKDIVDYLEYFYPDENTKGYSDATISTRLNLEKLDYINSDKESVLRKKHRWLIRLREILDEIDDRWRLKDAKKQRQVRPGSKASIFLKSKWEVYYYKTEEGEVGVKKGIAKGFMSFVKDEKNNSITFNTPKGTYKGFFEILDNKNFIRFVLQTENNERFLQMLGYIGSASSPKTLPKLILLGYTNFVSNESIVTGFMVLKNYTSEGMPNIKTGFFSKDEDGYYSHIDETIRDFFSLSFNSPHIIIPSRILSLYQLKKMINMWEN